MVVSMEGKKYFLSTRFFADQSTEKNTYTYVDSLRKSTWRSESEVSLNCSGQFAFGFPGPRQNDGQAGSGPIPGIVFPAQHKLMNTGLLISATAASSGTDKQDAFTRLCQGSKTGSPSAADWIAEIKRIWARGPANTLELARAVAAAKNLARHGQWQEIWKALPFSRRKADMLAAIGVRLRWVKWQTFANLPLGWSTLYELSKLPRAVFEEFVRNGVIHPGLKLREAKALVARFRGKPTETKTRKANVRHWLRRSAEFVRDTVSEWEADERELATEQLTRLLEQIATAGGIVLMRDGNFLISPNATL